MQYIRFFILSLLLINLTQLSLQAQRGARQGSGELFSLVGKVSDETGETPLEYATLTLLNAQDSTVVTGTVSNAKGAFQIEAPAGTYILKISFLGFEAQYRSNVSLSADKPFLRLEEIRLQAKATELDEVEIVGQKSRMEFSLDKRVFNVGQDLANNGGTAADLLDNIPSVTVDIEGNVAVRGNSGVRLLINGKPSGLTNINPADALKQLPANMIDKVEIITNPSARYEAEGSAGILNIVLKEERRAGWNGTFNLTGGLPHSHNASININHRRDKLNLFASLVGRYRWSPRSSIENREVYRNGETYYLDQEQLSYRGGLSGNIRMGAEYFFDKNTSLTGSFLYRRGLDRNEGQIRYFDYGKDRLLDEETLRDNEEDEDDRSLDYTLSFERKFARKGHKFTADLIYTSGGETESMNAFEQAVDPNTGKLIGSPDVFQRINNAENERELTLMADYVQPFRKDGKFELGYRGSIRNIDNSYLVEDQDIETQVWIPLANVSNDFAYDEEIHATYAIIGDKLNKISYQFGLRGEFTHVQTELKNTQEANDKQYFNLFPSAFLTYEFNAGNALQLSYSRRLRRPRFHDLNPFFTYSNPLNFRSGNPDLDPEFAHSVEVNYLRYWEKTTLSVGIYGKHTDGVITRISTLDEAGVNISRPENLNTRDDLGAEMNLNLAPYKWLDLNWSVNAYFSRINGANLGFGDQTDFFSYTSRLNTRFSFSKAFDAQLMVNYRGPERNPQGRRFAILYTDLGLSKDIWKQKATISFRIRDIFNTMWFRYETMGEDFYLYREGQWRARRQLYLGFTYRLNQKKQRRRGGRGNDGGGDFDDPGM